MKRCKGVNCSSIQGSFICVLVPGLLNEWKFFSHRSSCRWFRGCTRFDFQIQLVPDLARFRNSNPAGSGARFGENLFWGHRTICLMKLMASTMLSAAIKRQYSLALMLLHHHLAVFDKICGMAMNLVFILSW